MRRAISILLLVAAMLGRLAAEEPGILSLEQAISEAHDKAPELRRMQALSDAADWKKLEAVSGYLPHLGLSASQVLSESYLYLGVKFGGAAVLFPEAMPSSTLDLSVTQTLFDGLGAWHGYQAASLASQAARLERDDARFRIDAAVRLRYYQALSAGMLASVAAQNIATLQEHLDNAKAGEQSGLATRFEVLRVESKLEEAKAEKMLEEDNLALARSQLFMVLGQADADARDLGGGLPVPEASRLDGVDLSRVLRADLEAQALRAEASLQAQSASGAFWFPKVSLFGNQEYYKYDSYDPSIIASDGYQSAYTVGLNLRWELFDGGLSLAKQEQAKANALQAKEALANQRLKAPRDLEQWRRRYLYNASLYQARQRSLEESSESVRLAQLGLKAGTRSHTETLDAETDLFRARAGLVRAQMDAAEALINLELALGRSL